MRVPEDELASFFNGRTLGYQDGEWYWRTAEYDSDFELVDSVQLNYLGKYLYDHGYIENWSI